MNSHPILFTSPMVRAILDGSKTQTRRVVKPCKDHYTGCNLAPCEIAGEINGERYENSKYIPGDQLWVRETWLKTNPWSETGMHAYGYRATDKAKYPDAVWKPSIHMPRAASRITLEVTRIKVEKLKDISQAHAEAEGVGLRRVSDTDYRFIDYSDKEGRRTFGDPRDSYWSLWESINGPGSWAANPWVWVIEFKRVKP